MGKTLRKFSKNIKKTKGKRKTRGRKQIRRKTIRCKRKCKRKGGDWNSKQFPVGEDTQRCT